LASPDVDLILGDHVHVVQPCEKINGKYVIYGMGNFLSNQSPSQDKSLAPDNEDGTISTFSVQEVSPGTFHTTGYVYTPTRVVIPSHRIVPATPDGARASYDRTVGSVGLLGAGACDARPEF
jgi:poly-gamma-glutamate synthesis protein (capsule biosynthesis protein)